MLLMIFLPPLLKKAMTNKFITIAIALAGLFITNGLVKGGLVEVSGFPHIPGDDVTVNISLISGTQEDITDSILRIVELKAGELNKELRSKRWDKKDVFLSAQRSIGRNNLNDVGSHAGTVKFELLPGEIRKMSAFKIGNLLRSKIDKLPEIQKLSMGRGRWGSAIDISLLSDDPVKMNKVKELLKEKLRNYSGLKDINDNDAQGRREIRLQLLPKAYAVGLTHRDISRQIRQGFFGMEIQRLQRRNDEIRIWVRYTPEDRSSIGKLERMKIRTPLGKSFFLSELASYTIKRGIVNIVHLDGKREIRVQAALEDPNASVESVMEEIKSKTVPEILSQVEGVKVSYEGRERSNRKFAKSFMNSFPLALMGILIILSLVFRSYLQAILIFLMIPLGLIGAVFGHLVHDMLISRLSMFGIIALTGIIINDSIVYIDKINRNLKEGLTVFDAVFEAGLTRLRPILLTTFTTVLGLAPLIMETSRQAQFLIPMAVSIAYGLLVGSMLILFIVPSLFLLLNTLRYRVAHFFDSSVTRESVEPAVKEMQMKSELESTT